MKEFLPLGQGSSEASTGALGAGSSSDGWCRAALGQFARPLSLCPHPPPGPGPPHLSQSICCNSALISGCTLSPISLSLLSQEGTPFLWYGIPVTFTPKDGQVS